MRFHRLWPSLLLGAALTGCTDLDLTNPNQPSSGTFWQSDVDAIKGVNATYNALMNNGTYGRWLPFATDLRADDGLVLSPWTDLSNFTKFTFVDYNFEVNREIWIHHYQAINRANQVIARVPGIDMDPALRDRLIGEAKFIRALMYYNLVSLYERVPLQTTEALPTDRPATVDSGVTWAQIEQDLADAVDVLPDAYTGNDVGRATKGAANALLGKAHLQQKEWAAAAAAFDLVVGSPANYDLVADYADNFTELNENNEESVFEVQFGDRTLLASGVRGLNISRMVGPCAPEPLPSPSYCDGRPTRYLYNEFLRDSTTAGEVDPRLNATLYYNGGTDVYTVPNAEYFTDNAGTTSIREDTLIFWKKWGEYYLGIDEQDWDAGINFRVIRFADVLLGRAEAVNEVSGPTAQVYDDVNRVRRRVDLADLPTGLSQSQMRDAILHERLLEFALEAQRWNDLARHGMLNKATLLAHDPIEFQFFVDGTSERLPIPQTEIDLNPNAEQNVGW